MSNQATSNNTNLFSSLGNAYRKIVPNPLISSLILGAGAFGLTKLFQNQFIDTSKVLLSPIMARKMGISREEWYNIAEELKHNKKYNMWIPALAGLTLAGGSLAMSYRPGEKYKGLLSWNAAPTTKAPSLDYATGRDFSAVPKNPLINRAVPDNANYYNTRKIASEDIFSSSFTPSQDLTKMINVKSTMDLFTKDPYLNNTNNSYVRNLGTSIVADAGNRSGSNYAPLGTVYDSAFDKLKNKISLSGIATIGLKSMIANEAASLFTNAIGLVTDMSQETKNDIIAAGTWAGTIKAILD